MTPPPADMFAGRLLLGPALRAQSDGRLVTLVREGYDTAFEEIVRRYRRPLDRFAASFVGGRSEDVIQDALSKALLSLRGSENEIELRPWLYRIVRNTALNELRDRPPTVDQLEQALEGGRSAAAEAESREEITELMARLRALPEPQRAAIVMRELEGLSHEEIAANLGLSGGAARQTIYRARAALRTGLGALVPLPLLRTLFDHGTEAAAGGALATGGTGLALGGLSGAAAVKAGLATVLVAGSIGAGVAYEQNRGGPGPERAEAAVTRSGPEAATSTAGAGGNAVPPAPDSGGPGSGSSDDRGRGREAEPGDDRGRGSGKDREERDDRDERDDRGEDNSGRGSGRERGKDDSPGHGSRSGKGSRESDDDDDDDSSGHGSEPSSSSGSSRHSGSSATGGSGSNFGSGSRHSGGDDSSSGSFGSSGSDSGSSGSSGGGSGKELESDDESAVATPAPPAPEVETDGDGGDGSGSSGSGSGGSGGSDDD